MGRTAAEPDVGPEDQSHGQVGGDCEEVKRDGCPGRWWEPPAVRLPCFRRKICARTDRGIVRSLPHQVGGHGRGDPSVRNGSVAGGSIIGGTMCRHRPLPRATRAGPHIRKTAICPISLLPSSSVGEPDRIRLAQGRCMESAGTGLTGVWSSDVRWIRASWVAPVWPEAYPLDGQIGRPVPSPSRHPPGFSRTAVNERRSVATLGPATRTGGSRCERCWGR